MNKRELNKRWKANHLKALESLGFKPSAYNRLRHLENRAHNAAEKYCNGEVMGLSYEMVISQIEESVLKLCGGKLVGFFANGDPRGYALKIESDNLPEGMHKDWGGYGIIAPEFK